MSTVLIIEDDLSIAELQRDYLELAGYDVRIEAAGDKGLEAALAGDCDLVIVDVALPGMDGFEVCRRIRAARQVPILIVSSRKEDIDKIRGFGFGADDYVTKPFSPGELVARVKAHLTRYERLLGSADRMKPEIRIGGLSIDKWTRSVRANGREVVLTLKEFDLLAFLAMHPNRVFSREELFEKVWGFDASGDVTTVTVHIRKLRERIERDPSDPQYIETIWGIGYRMKV